MRPCVTLQLPETAQAPTSLGGKKALLVGYGYVAKALAPELIKAGVTVRHANRAGTDLIFGSSDMIQAFKAANIILISPPPTKDGIDPTLAALSGQKTNASWIGYLSATSVYGDRDGQWAYEGEAPTPRLARGRRRADAELKWLETYPQTQIFRLAGIYGPGRSPFAKITSGEARIIEAPGHIVNRIHVQDIVTALMASITRPSPQDIYNIADGNPASPEDVMNYAARLIDAPPPKRVKLQDPSLSAMARSFYAESKRIDISRAKSRLSWTPKFKTYREGLRSVLQEEQHMTR